MATNNNDEVFGGFSAISDIISGGFNTIGSVVDDIDDDNIPLLIGDDDVSGEDIIPPIINKDNDNDDNSDDNSDDNIEKEKDKEKNDNDNSDDDSKVDDDIKDLGEYEEDVSLYLKEKLQEMGLSFTDDMNIKSVEDIAEYLTEIVEENSKPIYPSEEVRQLAEYVENGGDLKNFYENVYSGVDIDTIDIDNEPDQRALVFEDLKNKGYTKVQIDKKIKRYEEAGVLEDEAKESLDSVKEFRSKNQEKLLKEQKKRNEDVREQQHTFISNVQESIKSINIAGISIPTKEKKELEDYILRTDRNGLSDYQKDFSKDPANSLVEAAYFKKNRDVLLNKIKTKQESDVTKDFRKKLENTQGTRGKNITQRQRSSNDKNISLGSLGKLFN